MKNIRRICKITIFSLCFMLYTTGMALAASLLLETNQSTNLSAGGDITSVAIANPEIADVTVISRTEMLIVAKKPGTTTLSIWTTNGMRQEYAVSVQNRDTETAIGIEHMIGYPDVTVEKVGDKVLLHGTVANQTENNRAVKIAEMYSGKEAKDSVINLLEMTRPLQVRLEAKIVEISTDKVKELGIQYGNASDIDTTSGIVSMGTSGVFGFGQSFSNSRDSSNSNIGSYADINATLQALITNGEAKLLSQPNVVTMSGEKADILVGGEIPIPVSNDNGQITVEWREYGIKLHIEPQANMDERITSKIKAEVSSLDWNSAVAINTSGIQIPALRSRKAETVINMPSGSTMVIGGLLNSEESRQVMKIPFLGDLPIIGQFFRNTSTSKEKKELIILVTPTLVDETTPTKMSDEIKALMNSDNAAEKTDAKKK